MAALRPWLLAARGAAETVVRALVRTYAAVLFSRSLLVGVLLLMATATAPRAFVGGILGVLAALGAAWLLDLDREALRDGSYGVSALLLGLGIGQTLGLGPTAVVVLLHLAALCALLTAGLRTLLASSNLPVLSIPFLIVFYLLLGLVPITGLTYEHPLRDQSLLFSSHFSSVIAEILRNVGSLLFLPRWDAGALLLLALLLHSRIAVLLAAIGAGAIYVLTLGLPLLATSELLPVLTLNAVFTAIAIGGVWFVPSPSSMLLAIGSVLLSALFTVGIAGPLARIGLPILIVPFNVAVIFVLLAARQRAWDRRPKSVDFSPGTPEQNLAYFRTRLLRFRWLYPTRFRLPVRGAWLCTQGVDGKVSHQGRWRHAFDFEVADSEGKLHAGSGAEVKDYYCYRLPVVAAAGGVVAKIENTVADNESGGMNLEQNWGNYVIIYHAPGLYSMVAHLQRGSIKVAEGQSVRQGELLGLCGNSGRSPRPHVHFQLQTGNRPGDGTLPCRFTDAVQAAGDAKSSAAERVVADLCPIEGEQVRNLEFDEDRAAFFRYAYRSAWRFQVGKSSEQLEIDIDVNGQPLLRTGDSSARLFYSLSDGFFTVYDGAGAMTPALQILRAALSRVPLDASESMRWTDYLPARQFRGPLWRVVSDLVSPFLHRDGIEMEYRMRRVGATLTIEGTSQSKDRRGEPLLRTHAELARGDGPLTASITLRGQTLSMQRESATDSTKPDNRNS